MADTAPTRQRAPERPVVSFRAQADLHHKLNMLRATFPEQKWGEVFDWVFSQDCLVERIRERLNS